MNDNYITNIEEAKEIIIKSLEKEGVDLLALARDIQLNDDCWCIATSAVDVENVDDYTSYHVSISTTCGVGSDDKFEIKSGEKERWSRCISRIIRIKVYENVGDEIDSMDHNVGINTNDNKFQINGGRLVHGTL